jgi:hypothetical protein
VSSPTLIRNFVAGGAIAANRIVKFGTADGQVVQAAAATDLLIGVCHQPGGAASGARCDVVLEGVTEVQAGGTITRGTQVTADANGKAVAVTAAAGSNVRVVGTALVSAANDDLIPILLGVGSFQG